MAVLGHSVHKPATFASHLPVPISWGRDGLGCNVSTLFCSHRPSLLPSHHFLPYDVLTHLLSHSFQELSYFHPHSSCFSHYHSQKLWISTFLCLGLSSPGQLLRQGLSCITHCTHSSVHHPSSGLLSPSQHTNPQGQRTSPLSMGAAAGIHTIPAHPEPRATSSSRWLNQPRGTPA